MFPAVGEEDAIDRALKWAHADADCPPWRPLLRESLSFASAELADPPPAPVELPVRRDAQLELPFVPSLLRAA
jgi:hypothetical protein